MIGDLRSSTVGATFTAGSTFFTWGSACSICTGTACTAASSSMIGTLDILHDIVIVVIGTAIMSQGADLGLNIDVLPTKQLVDNLA